VLRKARKSDNYFATRSSYWQWYTCLWRNEGQHAIHLHFNKIIHDNWSDTFTLIFT